MKNRQLTRKSGLFLLGFLVIVSCENKLSGQKIVDELAAEICGCIELKEYKNASEIEPCFDELFKEKKKLIHAHYRTTKPTESQFIELHNKTIAKMAYSCDYILKNFPTGFVGQTRAKQQNVSCSGLKDGEFFYLLQTPDPKITDTAFVSISGDIYLEKMRNRTTYSRLNIVWKDDCNFDLIFEESNDPLKMELFKKGQVLNYEVIANEDESFFVEGNWKGTIFQYQMFKIK
jgi:hypothetical protein